LNECNLRTTNPSATQPCESKKSGPEDQVLSQPGKMSCKQGLTIVPRGERALPIAWSTLRT
jgi:hypothetical protein